MRYSTLRSSTAVAALTNIAPPAIPTLPPATDTTMPAISRTAGIP
jgi:hypothetical protein